MNEDTGQVVSVSISSFAAMRAVVAIIVAVMSVTTGGPTRCPCQIAALFRAGTQTCEPPPAQKRSQEKRACRCHSHCESSEQQPEHPTPPPESPKCPHGPGIDLAPPQSATDRAASDAGDLSQLEFAATHGLFAVAPRGHSGLFDPGTHLSPHPDRLRYCHSFRC